MNIMVTISTQKHDTILPKLICCDYGLPTECGIFTLHAQIVNARTWRSIIPGKVESDILHAAELHELSGIFHDAGAILGEVKILGAFCALQNEYEYLCEC